MMGNRLYSHLLQVPDILAVGLYMTIAAALPQVAFPFNSQVPTVARVAESYAFQISPTTFARDGSMNLTYALVDPPAWLNIDSDSGTLYGMPGQGNSGTTQFAISATDTVGSVSMQCTLFVSTSSSPQVSGNISEVLRKSGALSGPKTMALYSGESFSISFGKNFFEAGSAQTKYFYATLSDHTPLPSWLIFEEYSLAFLGVAPVPAGGPQSWTIDLIASDVAGFAGVIATFVLEISTNTLAFTSQYDSLTAIAGSSLVYKSLVSDLFLNGKAVTRDQIRYADLQAPSWLSLQKDTLDLEGTPPEGFQSQNVRVSVGDIYGDVATKTLYIHERNVSLFSRNPDNLTATAGKYFTYTLKQSMFDQRNLNVTVDLGTASSWLHYDVTKLQLSGKPASTTKSQEVVLTITATSSSLSKSESRKVDLHIEAAPLGELSTSTMSIAGTASSFTSSTLSTKTTTATPLGTPVNDASTTHHSVAAGIAVAIVIGSLAFLALVTSVVMLACRGKRRRSGCEPGRLKISKPMHPGIAPVMPEEDRQGDVEKATGVQEQPPQLDLPLRSSSLGTPQPRYSLSLMSSIGEGEAAIKADPNIPVWGRKSGTAHTPHDSYSAATELARVNSKASQARLSQFTRLSPKKRISKLRYSWQSQLKRNNSARSRTSLRGIISRHLGHSRISSVLSDTLDRSSATSLNTYGTSMLSPRMSAFPEPPGATNRSSLAIPTVSIQQVDNRRSIRLVSRSESDRTDDRPLVEKRQSFIRNRASSSTVSPLFASSRRSSNMRGDDGLAVNSHGSLNRGRSNRTMVSASSSLEPPARNPRRLMSGTSSFANSLRRTNSAAPTRSSSPSRVIVEDQSENYTTLTGTATSSSANNIEDDQAPADFVAQLAWPRHRRDFVLPGEASPTPPPSSAPRDRDAARRKWAQKLGRDCRGKRVTRSESVESPVRLTDVAQRLARKKEHDEVDPEEEDGKKSDRLSLLVSTDSINGALRKRGKRDEVRTRVDPQTMAGAEASDSEWEDVTSNRASAAGSIFHACEGGNSEIDDSMGGKAFI